MKNKPKDNPDKLNRYLPTAYENKIVKEYNEAAPFSYDEMADLPF